MSERSAALLQYDKNALCGHWSPELHATLHINTPRTHGKTTATPICVDRDMYNYVTPRVYALN